MILQTPLLHRTLSDWIAIEPHQPAAAIDPLAALAVAKAGAAEPRAPQRCLLVVGMRTRATRRAVLAFAGAAAGVSALGGCPAPARKQPTGAEPAYLIFLTTRAGVTVLDQHGQVVVPPTVVAASTPDWRHAVTASPDGAGTRVLVQDLPSRQVLSACTLRGRLEPRVVSAAGTQVASVTPGGAGVYGLHDPGGRDRTTVVVSQPGGERVRLDLPGNVEPEVFSPDGNALYVLDYVPALEPRRYRVRVVDLRTRRMDAVPTRALPPGAGEDMHVHRIERVYDPRRAMLFTLCSHEADAVAFVHCLHVGQRWARRVELPAPFGQGRPGVHAIALSAAGDRLSVVHSLSAKVADLDPDRFVVKQVSSFAATRQDGKPGVLITASGSLVVNVDRRVFVAGPRREISTPGGARGLAAGTGNDIWVGHPNGLVQYDLGTGKEIRRLTVPGLYVLKHVRTTAG